MRVVEKSNGQIFEICNKKEFLAIVKDCKQAKVMPSDQLLFVRYKDGTEYVISEGEKVELKYIQNIDSGHCINCNTIACYKTEISYNEEYEDWEIKE